MVVGGQRPQGVAAAEPVGSSGGRPCLLPGDVDYAGGRGTARKSPLSASTLSALRFSPRFNWQNSVNAQPLPPPLTLLTAGSLTPAAGGG
jgi:hypothetical protein